MTNTAKQIPERLDQEDLATLCQEFDLGNVELSSDPRNQAMFMAMHYLGMCRHPFASADWLAHNSAFCTQSDLLYKKFGEQKSNALYLRVKGIIQAKYGCEANY